MTSVELFNCNFSLDMRAEGIDGSDGEIQFLGDLPLVPLPWPIMRNTLPIRDRSVYGARTTIHRAGHA